MNSNRHTMIFAILDKAHPGNHGMDVARWGELEASLKDSKFACITMRVVYKWVVLWLYSNIISAFHEESL